MCIRDSPEHRPQMATVREGVMKKEILDADYKGEVIRHDVAKYVPETDYPMCSSGSTFLFLCVRRNSKLRI